MSAARQPDGDPPAKPSLWKRTWAWVGRWWSLATNTLGTVLLCLWGLLILGVDHPSTTRLIWVWVAGISGAVLYVGSQVRGAVEQREDRIKLARLEAETLGRADAEKRLNQLLEKMRGSLRNTLMACAGHLGFAASERIGIYAHDPETGLLSRYSRFCPKTALNDQDLGELDLPADEGLIGIAFAHAEEFSRYVVRFDPNLAASDPRTKWESYMTQNGALAQARIAKMRMQSKLYLFASLTSPTTRTRVGILVVESENANGVNYAKFKAMVEQKHLELVNALQHFSEAKDVAERAVVDPTSVGRVAS